MIAALALPVMIGAAGLAFDLNRGYQEREINQRAADMGALGAAMAFRTTTNAALLQPTANGLANVNGVRNGTITADVVADFPNAGDQSVRVRVTSHVPYVLGRVLGLTGGFDVRAESFATLVTQQQYAAPCFLALSSAADALKVTGGASINAPTCSVAAVGSVDNQGALIAGHDIIAGGGNITNNYGTLSAESLRFAGSFNNHAWNTNVPAANKRKNQATPLADPWAGSTELTSARAQIGTFTAVPALTNPGTANAGAKDWSLDWSPAAHVAGYRKDNTYTIPTGTYYIKKLSTGGGINVTFGDGSNIYIDGGFANGGGSNVNFGNSNLYVNGGFDSGSNGITIGNGNLWIGSGTVALQGTNRKGNGQVIVNATIKLGGGQKLFMGVGNHSFGGFDLAGGGSASLGDGDFLARTGVKIDGDSELALGTGNIVIGPMSGGNAINLAGSARFFMADGTFSANGHIITSGGSKIVFGKTLNHYINGNMTIAGAALFGAGRYTINGNFVNGTGGTTWPYTSALTNKTYGQTLEGISVSGYDMAGVNVTFIAGGTLNLAGGAKTKLIAPTATVAGGGIGDMLFHSLTAATTTWSAGASSLFSGTVHLPQSTVKMSGGNTTLSTGQCFTLVSNKIEVTGGAATGTACPTMSGDAGGSSSSEIRLLR